MDAFLSGLNPVQIGATILAISLIVICQVVLPAVIGIAAIVDKIRIRMGLEPFGDNRTLPQLVESEHSE